MNLIWQRPDVPLLFHDAHAGSVHFVSSRRRSDQSMKIYVGNLSFDTTEETLKSLFAEHGEVEEVHIVTDRETGRPRGFGFVTMPNDNEAKAAIEAVNGTEVDNRALNVNEARPKEGGSRGGGGRGRGGSRGGGDRRW